MRFGVLVLAGGLVVIGLISASAASAASAAGPRVYIMRGLAGMFSTGMDELAAKLQRRGVNTSVHSFADFDRIADKAVAHYRKRRAPIAIIGHSLGADTALLMAEELNEAGVPVALVVTFSPSQSVQAPANVAQIVNYYQAGSIWKGRVTPGPGFRGTIRNVNLDGASDITHFNIDEAERLQNETIAKILALAGRRRPAPAAARPATPATRTQ